MKSTCTLFGNAWSVPSSWSLAVLLVGLLCSWPANVVAQSEAAPKAEEKAASKQEPATDDEKAEAEAEEAIQKNQEERLDRAAAKKNEESQPVKKKPRSEYIAKPGAPRERMPNYIRSELLKAEKPSPPEEELFNQMRRGQKDPTPALIDKIAKWHVYNLTQPGDEARISWKANEILKIVFDAKTGRSEPNERFRSMFKRSLVKYSKDLLQNSLVVKVNAVILMGDLFDGIADVPDAVPVLMEVLGSDSHEEAVYYTALRSLDRAKQYRQLTIQQERQIIRDVIRLAQRDEVQPVLFEQLVRTLGNLRHAFSGPIPDRAEVATLLANLALDPDKPLRLRYEAARGVGRLDVRDVPTWNHQLQALVLCVFLKDITQAQINGEIENADVFRLWWWKLAGDLKDIFAKSDNTNNPNFQELVPILGTLVSKVLANSLIQQSDLNPLVEWIDKQQGISKKLASDAKELDTFGVNPQATNDGKAL